LLGTHRLSRYFDDQVTAEEGLARKPDPEGVEWLIGRHALLRDEVLLIGDREVDLFAGQAAGVRTCRFGSALPVEADADWVIRDYDRLLRLLCTENLDEDWLARDHGYMMGVDRLLRPIHT
jgi:phosphoglycolate phosphatase-like HAD superfamily hydrolase